MVILNSEATIRRPFSGRVVFDHLPKTAGTSVNRWLLEALGDGNVSDIVTGLHRSALRRYGGQFCLITGHLDFINAEGLDPRWQYTTILRDPVDRALSWLYFVIRHYTTDTLPGIYQACTQFVESNGEMIADIIYPSISNLYTAHFSRILGWGNEGDEVRLANAQAALDQYNLVGVSEDYAGYTEQLARLLDLKHIPPIRYFNRTQGRPELGETSAALRSALDRLNNIDRELYDATRQKIVEGFWDQSARFNRNTEVVAFPAPQRSIRRSEEINLTDIDLISRSHLQTREMIMARVTIETFSLITRLQCGLHILDDRGEIAFGINSTLLDQDLENIEPGSHTITYQIMADLPVGTYTLGISFYDRSCDTPRELYWHDGLYVFSIIPYKGAKGIGYSPCLSQIRATSISTGSKALKK